jgi:hypothetical protein
MRTKATLNLKDKVVGAGWGGSSISRKTKASVGKNIKCFLKIKYSQKGLGNGPNLMYLSDKVLGPEYKLQYHQKELMAKLYPFLLVKKNCIQNPT